VYLPDLTLGKLEAWIAARGLGENDFCFTIAGRPVRPEEAERVFYRTLQKTGFIPYPAKKKPEKRGEGWRRPPQIKQRPPDGRKLVPHSLRYTYVSRMRRELTAAELQPMTGHASVEMVDYYNRKVLDMVLVSLPQKGKAAADTLFV
jgi:integrase